MAIVRFDSSKYGYRTLAGLIGELRNDLAGLDRYKQKELVTIRFERERYGGYGVAEASIIKRKSFFGICELESIAYNMLLTVTAQVEPTLMYDADDDDVAEIAERHFEAWRTQYPSIEEIRRFPLTWG